MAARTALTLAVSTSGVSPRLAASMERASVDTVTATPADCVLLLAAVFASVLATGPLLAAEAALVLTATGLSEGWLIFMVFSKTTVYVAS
jgi:hypothetical protein